MLGPSESDWSYQEIAAERAAKLASAGDCDALIEALDDAFEKALPDNIRVGFDGISNYLGAPRVTIQFPVPGELYDWFFSARTGYRAQFWISPEAGLAFNTRLLQRLRATIGRWAPHSDVHGREIWVEKYRGDREDIDKGPRTVSRSTVLTSLDPVLSKLWICERQIQHDVGALVAMPIGSMGPKLRIPRWQGSGLFAPHPGVGDAWLDIKGGYVQPDGTVSQPKKSPEQRAKQIHKTGWT